MKNKISVFIIAAIVIIAVIACMYLAVPVKLTDEVSENVEIVSVTHEPKNPLPGEEITIRAVIENGTLFNTKLQYNSYFGNGSLSYGKPLRIENESTFIWNIGSYTNSTEIWYIISVTDKNRDITFSEEKTIQVGHHIRSNITSLTISNVSFTPENPTTKDSSVTVSANITSNVTMSYSGLEHMKFYPYGSGSGGSGGGGKNSTDFKEMINFRNELSAGTKVLFKVVAQDESGNTAVSPTYSYTIS